MYWFFFFLGMIDTIAGSILFFNEAILVKLIGIMLLGKGVITIIKSLV